MKCMGLLGYMPTAVGSNLTSSTLIGLEQLMQTLLEVPDPGCDAIVMHEAPCSKAARPTQAQPCSHPRHDHAKTDE